MKCLSNGPQLSRELWLISHRELRHSAPVAAVIDWLLQHVTSRLA
jgi:DNA-binding transcriptional LysR family regulator